MMAILRIIGIEVERKMLLSNIVKSGVVSKQTEQSIWSGISFFFDFLVYSLNQIILV